MCFERKRVLLLIRLAVDPTGMSCSRALFSFVSLLQVSIKLYSFDVSVLMGVEVSSEPKYIDIGVKKGNFLEQSVFRHFEGLGHTDIFLGAAPEPPF